MGTDVSQPAIALLTPPGLRAEGVVARLREAGATVVAIGVEDPLPPHASGLLVVGEGPFGLSAEPVPQALREAIASDVPVLAIDWGMHVLNAAYGSKPPVGIAHHGSVAGGSPSRHRIFLSLGGKVASMIGGAGVVTVTSAHRFGHFEAGRGRGLMTSAFSLDDGVVEAVEVPGRHWIIGVQWPAHLNEGLPSGFGNLVPAFVQQAKKRSGRDTVGNTR